MVNKDHLYSFTSGAPASSVVELDVLHAEAIAKKAKDKFIQDHFVIGSSEALFFEAIKKNNSKMMEAYNTL